MSAGKKLLMVGSGRMGQIRLRAASHVPGLKLCGIVDANEEQGKSFAQHYDVPHASNIKQFLQSEQRPDGIWITTPTPSHEELIHFAAAKGIPVATEKPVAMDASTIQRCYDVCGKAGVALFCAFQRRVDPHFQAIKEHIDDHNIGDIQSMHSIFRDHPVPPIDFLVQGGDLFHDCGVHDIDFARSLVKGHEVCRVHALGHSFNEALRAHNVMDVVTGLLQFDNHVMYSIEVARTATYGYDQRFEVFGDSGCVKTNNVHEHSCSLETSKGVNTACYQYSFPNRFEQGFRLELERFANVLRGEEEPFVSCVDACRATQVAEACRLSVFHKASITIQYDADMPSRCEYAFSEAAQQSKKIASVTNNYAEQLFA